MIPLRRALTILGRELQLQQRYGVLYAALVVVGLWAAVFAFLEEPTRRFLLPPVIVMDTAIFGFFLMTAMMFLEKSDRVLAAIVVSPLSTGRYLLNKVLSLTIVTSPSIARSASSTACNSIRWLVVRAAPPEPRGEPSGATAHAQPPGPGFPAQAPSV